MKRIPKLPGFTSHRPVVETVYTGQLDALGATVDNHKLAEAGLVASAYSKVKLVVKGDVTKKVAVKLQGASQQAIKAVEKAGGKFEKVDQIGRSKNPKPESK